MSTIKTLLNELQYKERLANINYGSGCLNDKLGALDEKSITQIFPLYKQKGRKFMLYLLLHISDLQNKSLS